jgi:hypothetical protein
VLCFPNAHLFPSIISSLFLIALAMVPFGCSPSDDSDSIGPPTGKTGNEWTEADFADSDSALAKQGGPEFVAFCKEAGTCELDGEVFEKLKEVFGKYPVENREEFDHFAVVVRDGLIENGLLPEGDPERYQYKLESLAIALGVQ